MLPILHERQIIGVGYDGDGEAVPSNCEGIAYPIHAISIPALGWWTMDSLDLDDLATACAEEAAGSSRSPSRRCGWPTGRARR